MHYKEMDYRSAPLRVLSTASTNAVAELAGFSTEGIMDGGTAMEYAESFHGALLVACQAYAVGTVSDINEIQESNYSKIELYKYKETNYHDYTHVELINALANFFKHNEEWVSWPVNGTTKTLRYFGINEDTEFPLYTGIKVIIGESTDFGGLCKVLEDWRFALLYLRNPK